MNALVKWFLQKIKNFKKTSSMTEEEKFLSKSVSLEDLERRQKMVTYGKAPYQLEYQYYFDAYGNGRIYR